MSAEQAPGTGANKLPIIPILLVAVAGIAAAALWSSQVHLFGPSLEVTKEDITDTLFGIFTTVEVTNTGSDPVVINEIRVNGRDQKGCIAKPNARFQTGGSYRVTVASLVCGKVVRVLVKTSDGDQEFTW